VSHYRRILLIQNLSSGRAPHEVAHEQIAERLKEISEFLETVNVQEGVNVLERVAVGVAAGTNLVVVAGGDGTIREAAAGVLGTDATLGIIPMGTFNNLALSLDLPRDPMAACDLIVSGATRTIDVGVADGRHYFFEAAGVGVDADLFPIGEEVKSGRFHGILRAIRLALLHKQTPVLIKFDRSIDSAYRQSFRGQSELKRRRFRFRKARKQIRMRCSFLAIGNGPYYGSNFNVCPGALLDDGLLTLGIYRDFSKHELFWHFRSISGGRRQYHPKLEMFEAESIEVSSTVRLSIHVDGNPIGTTPVRFTIQKKALKVIAP
jgi:diacylglycerol kinase (ATP)